MHPFELKAPAQSHEFPVTPHAQLVTYFIFGVVNTVLLALAMRIITTATAFAAWMALSLIFTKIVDVFWLKSNWTGSELFFMSLILIGVVGLKVVMVL